MEQQVCSTSAFITLTFSDEHLPNPPYVSKRDLQLFFKRLRKLIAPRKIRYYACAEYGDKRGRPHYHAIIFGLSLSDQKLVEQAWGLGFVSVDKVELGSIAYVAGYVSKKFIHSKEFEFTGEVKEKEFALMSRRPALGTGFIDKLVPIAFSQNSFDVLSMISVGTQSFPLDRTIREKLRNIVMSPEFKEKICSLRKASYAEQLSENISEVLGEGAGSMFLSYFNSDKVSSSFASSAEKIFYSAHNQKVPELKDIERFEVRRHKRKDL